MWTYNDTSSLTHVGVKGMRWGKRTGDRGAPNRGQSMSEHDRKKLGLLKNDAKEFDRDVAIAKRKGGLKTKVKISVGHDGRMNKEVVKVDHKGREVNDDYVRAVNAAAKKPKTVKKRSEAESAEAKQEVKKLAIVGGKIAASMLAGVGGGILARDAASKYISSSNSVVTVAGILGGVVGVTAMSALTSTDRE